MKYVKFGDGFFGLADTATEDTMAAHGEKLYDATNKEVVAYLAAQAKAQEVAATLAKNKAEAVAIAAKALGLSGAQAKALRG